MTWQPSLDKNAPVVCYFSPKIYLAYKSYIGCFEKGQERVKNKSVRQCHYCQNFFAKSHYQMQKHLSICAAKEGITYSFDNSEIIDYQDNYKYIGDLPFVVYFDFETTTGDAVFLIQKFLSLVTAWFFCLIRH